MVPYNHYQARCQARVAQLPRSHFPKPLWPLEDRLGYSSVVVSLLLVAALLSGCEESEKGGNPNGDGDNVDMAVESPDTSETAAANAPIPLGDPRQPGPYSVGYRSVVVRYQPQGVPEPRDLPVALWYPTAATDGEEVYYQEIWKRPGVFVDAPPVDGRGLPVVVFSHGLGGFREQSWFLMEFLASHGFVVASAAHLADNAFDTSRELLRPQWFLRPQDVKAQLDFLFSLPAGDPLHGRLGNDVIVAGHSYGGYTTLAVAGARYNLADAEARCPAADDRLGGSLCDALLAPETRPLFEAGFLDPRIKLIIPQTPWILGFGNGAGGALGIPTLLFTGDRDRTTFDAKDGDPLWAVLNHAADRRVRVADAGHFSFSNACDIAAAVGRDDGCGGDFLPSAEVNAITNTYALAYIRAILWNDAAMLPLLDGTESVHTAARILAH